MKAVMASAVMAVAALFAVVPGEAKAQVLDIPITGVFDGGTFTGTADVERFVYERGVIRAVTTLTGTLTDAAGNVIGNVQDFQVMLPVTDASGTCDVLNLDLGPLDLDLLGLEVHLNRIDLDIVAQAGSGKLLGNLLCAVVKLLDGGASGNAISNLLNNILGLLG